MRCNVCGTEVKEGTPCPCCGFTPVDLAAIPDIYRAGMEGMIKNMRTMLFKDIKISLLAYYWQDVDGKLKEKARENLLLCDNFGTLDFDEVTWSDVEFARQTAGEKKVLNVIVESEGKAKTYSTSIIAPETDGTWKVGIILKPGLKVLLRVGDQSNFADTEEISLKG